MGELIATSLRWRTVFDHAGVSPPGRTAASGADLCACGRGAGHRRLCRPPMPPQDAEVLLVAVRAADLQKR
jgi:hypothetical protein